MGTRTSALIGGAGLAYNAVAAALESAAKASGLVRTAAAESLPMEVTVVEYAGKGTWLLLSSPTPVAGALARMIAPPLAKTLAKPVAVFIAQEGTGTAQAFQVERSGKASPPTARPLPSGEFDVAFVALLGAEESMVSHRQKRSYWHKPTTGNARLDRFLAQVKLATQVDYTQEPDGRFAVRLLLPGGAKQMSFFTEEEVAVVKAAASVPPVALKP